MVAPPVGKGVGVAVDEVIKLVASKLGYGGVLASGLKKALEKEIGISFEKLAEHLTEAELQALRAAANSGFRESLKKTAEQAVSRSASPAASALAGHAATAGAAKALSAAEKATNTILANLEGRNFGNTLQRIFGVAWKDVITELPEDTLKSLSRLTGRNLDAGLAHAINESAVKHGTQAVLATTLRGRALQGGYTYLRNNPWKVTGGAVVGTYGTYKTGSWLMSPGGVSVDELVNAGMVTPEMAERVKQTLKDAKIQKSDVGLCIDNFLHQAGIDKISDEGELRPLLIHATSCATAKAKERLVNAGSLPDSPLANVINPKNSGILSIIMVVVGGALALCGMPFVGIPIGLGALFSKQILQAFNGSGTSTAGGAGTHGSGNGQPRSTGGAGQVADAGTSYNQPGGFRPNLPPEAQGVKQAGPQPNL